MFRIVLGIIVGVLVASLIFFGFQALNGLFFPMPEGVNYSDPDAVREVMTKFISEIPAAGFALVLLGYAVGSLVGGFAAHKISRHASIVGPIVIGVFLSIGWIMNVVAIPHPVWVVVTGIFIFLPFTYLGHRLAAD